MADQQKQLQGLTDDFQKLQTGESAGGWPLGMLTRPPELQSVVEARQKLESQQQENKGVQKVPRSLSHRVASHHQEFSTLDDGAKIYKLVGPVLLKQDRSEAVLAVDGRLEFIEKEMCDSCISMVRFSLPQKTGREADRQPSGEQ